MTSMIPAPVLGRNLVPSALSPWEAVGEAVDFDEAPEIGFRV